MDSAAVFFYTGEYTNALTMILDRKAIHYRVVDQGTFEDGWTAGKGITPVGGPDQRVSADWGKYLEGQIKEDTRTYQISPLDIVQDAVFISFFDEQRLTEVAREFATELAHDMPGGDDSVFDYFPDAMEALAQLCKVIGTEESKRIYVDTYDSKMADQYAAYEGDPELWPWE